MASALGDFLVRISADRAARLPARATDAARWPTFGGGPPALQALEPAPGVSILHSGAFRVRASGAAGVLGLVHEPEEGRADSSAEASTQRVLAAWLDDPDWHPKSLRGRFVALRWDAREPALAACTDAFRTYSLYYQVTPAAVTVASDLRLILLASDAPPEADRQAIYHYLNFHYVPAPFCIVKGVAKLEAGSRLDARPGQAQATRFDDFRYAEDLARDDGSLANELRERIVGTVRKYRPGSSAWGTYLSGGTDSSSISGILAGAAPEPVDSFSIGFDEAAFDEMSYAQLAIDRFGLRGHSRSLGLQDGADIIPQLVRAFDEPFGNASSIATFGCASLARSAGKSLLVAGDGGDEIFGGNQRYAKDTVFNWYHHAPAPVHWAGSALSLALSAFDFHLTNRVRNMIARGRLPHPDRFYSDDSFASDDYAQLLTDSFRAAVPRDASLQFQREVHSRAQAASELHRVMYIDLKMTLGDNDVVKVVRTAKLEGIDVAFPYLDRDLVDYTGRLAARFKVSGLEKRPLFKRAMADILPIEIRKKKKHGFGVPVNAWMRRPGPVRDMVHDVLLSPQAAGRGELSPAFLRELIETNERGAWDYSAEIYLLLMLELWCREHLDAGR